MATAPSAFSCRESSKWQPCSRALGRSSRWVWPPSGPAGRLHQVTFSSSHIGPTITEERAAKSVVNHQQEEPMTFSGDDISLKQSLTTRWPPCDLPVTLKCCANELLVACASYLRVINQRPPNDLPVTLPTHSWCVKTLKRTEAFLLIFFFFLIVVEHKKGTKQREETTEAWRSSSNRIMLISVCSNCQTTIRIRFTR